MTQSSSAIDRLRKACTDSCTSPSDLNRKGLVTSAKFAIRYRPLVTSQKAFAEIIIIHCKNRGLGFVVFSPFLSFFFFSYLFFFWVMVGYSDCSASMLFHSKRCGEGHFEASLFQKPYGECTFKRNRPSFAVLMVLWGGGGTMPDCIAPPPGQNTVLSVWTLFSHYAKNRDKLFFFSGQVSNPPPPPFVQLPWESWSALHRQSSDCRKLPTNKFFDFSVFLCLSGRSPGCHGSQRRHVSATTKGNNLLAAFGCPERLSRVVTYQPNWQPEPNLLLSFSSLPHFFLSPLRKTFLDRNQRLSNIRARPFMIMQMLIGWHWTSSKYLHGNGALCQSS